MVFKLSPQSSSCQMNLDVVQCNYEMVKSNSRIGCNTSDVRSSCINHYIFIGFHSRLIQEPQRKELQERETGEVEYIHTLRAVLERNFRHSLGEVIGIHGTSGIFQKLISSRLHPFGIEAGRIEVSLGAAVCLPGS